MRPRRGRRDSGLLGNPLLMGAVTVLVTVVALMLAFNAENGLPFVPRYSLNVQVRDASELTHGADVRIGGTLVGFVSSVSAARDAAAQPIADVNVRLDESVKPLPVNSRFTIRLKGAIGLKYLQITPGNSKQGLPNGASVPAKQAGSEVDLDQVLSMFTPPTRAGVAATTIGYANGFAGRGSDLNDALGAFVPLLGDLGPVARNLASRHTDLAGFLRGLGRFAGALAPVAKTQGDLFTNLDTTFRSLARVAVPHLQDWISRTPPAFSAVISGSPTIRPFLTDTAALFKEMRPGVQTLSQSAPVLADAFAAGARNLPATAGLDQQVVNLSDRLASYGRTPAVQQGLDRLTLTASSLQAPLAFLAPAQVSCNYVTLFLRNIASLLSDRTGTGTSLRVLPVVIDDVPGGESVPSSHPYLTAAKPQDEHGPLHVNPYPNTDSPGQAPECAAGHENFSSQPFSVTRAVIGNPPGNLGVNSVQTTRSSG